MIYDAVPNELKAVKRWVNWGISRQNPKIPYTPHDIRKPAEANNPYSWGTFTEAVQCAEEFPGRGIGFELGDGFAGIDLDTIRDNRTGKIAPDALDIIHKVGSYTEFSPSGYMNEKLMVSASFRRK